MLNQLNPERYTETANQKLKAQKEQLQSVHLRELFAADSQRFNKYSIQFEQLLFDYSKHRINKNVMQCLIEWADAQNLRSWIGSLFSNQKINYTEQRAAMHWALRLPEHDQQHAELAADVHVQLERMYVLIEQIHAGQRRGATGEVVQDVVNIGVGGSDLGPLMVTHALSDFKYPSAQPLNVHFVSTMDGSQLSELLHQLRPETTLFIISSK